jgi:hypothetical protein
MRYLTPTEEYHGGTLSTRNASAREEREVGSNCVKLLRYDGVTPGDELTHDTRRETLAMRFRTKDDSQGYLFNRLQL